MKIDLGPIIVLMPMILFIILMMMDSCSESDFQACLKGGHNLEECKELR